MKKISFFLLILSLSIHVESQQLAAFNDYRNQFWVFEGGQFQKLEYLEIMDFQIGGPYVAYIDNGSNLKVYRNGKTENLIQGAPIKYKATDYLIGYSLYEQLNVYDNGEIKLLSTEADAYIVTDSLIAWHNRIRHTIQVYYNRNIYTVEDELIYNPIETYKLGDNIAAYIQNSTKEFKVFYRGDIMVLDQFVEAITFETAREIVAYTNHQDQEFKVFLKGEVHLLETASPKSFKVGDEFVAYIDNLGYLKYFDGGNAITVSTYEPQFYDVKDKVLIFEEQGFFKTFCNGQVYVIERYIPAIYKIDWNTIAYLDQNSFIKAFQHCEHIQVSYEIVRELMLYRDLIVFVTGINQTNVFFMGQVFNQY